MKKILIVCFMLCMILSGCSTNTAKEKTSQGTEKTEIGYYDSFIDENENIEETWVINEITMPDAGKILQDLVPEEGSVNIMLTGVAGGDVYRFSSLHSGTDDHKCIGYCIQKLVYPYEEWVCYQENLDSWGVGEECFPVFYGVKSYLTEDGTIHMVLRGEEALYLCQWNEKKGASGRKIDSESKLNELFKLGADLWYESDDGEIYVIIGNDIYCFNEMFQEKTISGTVPDGYIYQIIFNTFSQELFFMGASSDSVIENENSWEIHDGGFSVWQSGNDKPVYVADITEDTSQKELGAYMCETDCVAFSSETEGFLCNSSGIWQFSMEKSHRNRIYDYDADGIISTDSKRPIRTWASFREDGSLLILTYTLGGKYLLHELKTDDNNKDSEKQIVEVALTYDNVFLKKVIADYNKQSDKYKVVLRTPDNNEDWNDYRTRIQAELSTGNGPALLADTVLDMEVSQKQGYLEDLTEDFAFYEKVMMPSAWALGQIDGHCYGISYNCSVKTLVGNCDVIGNRASWTMEEAMQCTKISGAEAFTYDVDISPTTLFFYMGLVTGTNKNLIDWENKICCLNSEEALELLEFAGQYGELDNEDEDEYTKIKKGELLTRVLYLMSPNDMQQVTNLLNNKDTYVGFPVEDGGSGHIISGNVLLVNRFSPGKEGAIAFLEYLLSEEVQGQMVDEFVNSRYGYGFPVRSDSMEQVYEFLQNKPEKRKDSSDDLLAETERIPFTEEQVSILRNIFETARPGKGDSAAKIFTVVEEELPFYFSGQRSAKEVLDIVQNRAQLYMEESQ